MVFKKKGGKIAINDLGVLLNESYKSKDKTNKNINNKYELDEDLSTDKTKVYRKMKLPLNDIIMRDETHKISKDGFYIINLDNSKGKGTHWCCLFYYPLHSCYNDSFGFVPPVEIEKKIKPFTYNDRDIQDFNSDACGYYALAFIKFLHNKQNKKEAFKQFLQMFKNKTIENDDILHKYLFG